MVVVDPPGQFLMGAPHWEPDRVEKSGGEQYHWRRIGRRYSIATTETTVALFKEFQDDPRIKKIYAARPFIYSDRYALTPDCPQTSVRWHDAVRFCQWLTEREGIEKAEWCYPNALDVPEDQWQFPPDMLARRGYTDATAYEVVRTELDRELEWRRT